MEKIQQLQRDPTDLIREINIRLSTIQRLLDKLNLEIESLKDRVTILETP